MKVIYMLPYNNLTINIIIVLLFYHNFIIITTFVILYYLIYFINVLSCTFAVLGKVTMVLIFNRNLSIA